MSLGRHPSSAFVGSSAARRACTPFGAPLDRGRRLRASTRSNFGSGSCCALLGDVRRGRDTRGRRRRSSARESGSTWPRPASVRRRCARGPCATFIARYVAIGSMPSQISPGNPVAGGFVGHVGDRHLRATAASRSPSRCSATRKTIGSLCTAEKLTASCHSPSLVAPSPVVHEHRPAASRRICHRIRGTDGVRAVRRR